MDAICRYFFQVAAKIMMKKKKGTAMAPLMHMQKILSNRVQHFPTLEKAWNVRSGSLRNIDSARISITETVKYDDSQQYEGLSEKFMSSPVPQLLLLAGIDRLDKFFLFLPIQCCLDK
uniref:Uncharacterized protein n=1 Tax=Lactuca sativa TaxID=4236 RepID=A0A9R1WY31_LACSA|nr:hypothetical protein LSAT_V11C800409360 [Lactuca sativa]